MKKDIIDLSLFGERLSESLKDSVETSYTLADKLNLSPATISRYTNAKMMPKLATVYEISRILNINPEWLIGKSDQKHKNSLKTKSTKIPVLGKVIAGIPIDAVEEILDYEEISEEMARQGEFFALQIKGDSMEPRIKENDVVIVRKQQDIDSGDVAIILVNGYEATVKKVTKFPGGINLIPNNPSYDVITYTNEQIEKLPVQIVGKVVELRAKF